MSYTGRFAPSPTGPLHFGSLVAAVASYCDAKANHGKWLVRMEDLDKPREVNGAAETILRSLEVFGFEWDGEIVYQSKRAELYAEALATLQNKNLIYPCTCTRKEIVDSSTKLGIDGLIYPKTCLHQPAKPNLPCCQRIQTNASEITFNDAIQGEISQNLSSQVGDFVLKRADGLFAYQLAVIVDDATQGVTHIVRGADLLNSTPRQIYLQQRLNLPTPNYAHVPVACNLADEKLSKQTLAEPINMRLSGQLICNALSFLGQQPPVEIKNADLNDIWRWAITNWALTKVPKLRQIQLT
jgi:glutamyl-Q tRNA(Asp) synthetase